MFDAEKFGNCSSFAALRSTYYCGGLRVMQKKLLFLKKFFEVAAKLYKTLTFLFDNKFIPKN